MSRLSVLLKVCGLQFVCHCLQRTLSKLTDQGFCQHCLIARIFHFSQRCDSSLTTSYSAPAAASL
jgi:hypothetical protein